MATNWGDKIETPLDSARGMSIMLEFARAGGYVLSQDHRRLAEKYGLDASGVTFTEEMPVNE